MEKIDKRQAMLIVASVLAAVLLVLGVIFLVGAPNGHPIGTTVGGTEPQVPATTPSETTAPETSAPETSAPETTAPETTAPETTAPETTAPETTAPETTSPETTPPVTDPVQTPPENEPYQPINYKDVKAMWISQYDLYGVYTKSKKQRSESEFRSMMSVILDNAKKDGFNTVIVQVRPYADSMYPSEYYPMSRFVVGAYGREASYDPFAITLSFAHERGLSVHAWINPMRGMLESEVKSVSDKYAVKKWYSDKSTNGKQVVVVSDRLYFNTAYAEVRELIVNGAREILQKYNVDGLHMDDYFYPTQSASFDKSAYAEYTAGGGEKSLADFRREQLNALVSALYAMVKQENEGLMFGISPAGIINNVYNKQYADVYTWCSEEGYIDYICPQIYFGLEHENYDFIKVCNVWRDIIKTDSVKLIIGMTLEKADTGTDAYAGSGKDEWKKSTDILLRCLNYTETLEHCTGVSYFSYQFFYGPTNGVADKDTQAERDNFIPKLKEISWS